jgi:GT2 family glycosyltransferase
MEAEVRVANERTHRGELMTSPDLSVCIVNWNTRDDLEQAIDSVLKADPSLDLQVIVVDNASADGSAEMVRRRFPGVLLIESGGNLGFARGYNRAAAEARGRYLLMLNPDTATRPGALGRLVDFLDSNPEAGAAGPRLLNRDGSLQYSCRRFPKPLAAVFRNTVLGRVAPGNRFSREYLMVEWDHGEAREVEWVSGAAICIRRESWEEVGGFDEGFFMYAEDMDWCLRAQQAGWRICYVPEAVIAHCIGRSSDQRPLAMVGQFHRSMARFYGKHYARRWPRGTRWLPLFGIWARATLVMGQTLWAMGRDRVRGTGSKRG